MRWRVTSLTTSGRCSARDAVATETLAMAAISLIVLTRAVGAAPTRCLSVACRLVLVPSALTICRLLVDAALHDSIRSAPQQRPESGSPLRARHRFCAAQCNGLHE